MLTARNHPLARHRHERLLGHLRRLVRPRVVRVRVEHHRRERQHVRLVGVLEVVRVALAVARREPLHEPVDLLRLARHAERPEEKTKRLVEIQAREIVRVRVRLHHEKSVDVVRTEEFANRARVERPAAERSPSPRDGVRDGTRVAARVAVRVAVRVAARVARSDEKRGGARREPRVGDVHLFGVRLGNVFLTNLHHRRQRRDGRPSVERRRRRLRAGFPLLQRRERLALG